MKGFRTFAALLLVPTTLFFHIGYHHRTNPGLEPQGKIIRTGDETTKVIHRAAGQTYSPESSIWVSMSVCWSANTHLLGKANYPYAYAAKLGSMLWANRTTYKVIVYVVFQEEKEAEDLGLMELLAELRKYATIVRAVPAGRLDCPMRSQLQRIFGFQEPSVAERDFVVTSDVDAFVVDRDIFANLREGDFSVWLYQYAQVEDKQETIPMSFIAMRKTTWSKLIPADSVESLLEAFNTTFIEPIDSPFHLWYTDQKILSHVILESGLCTAKTGNGIWGLVGLAPPDPPIDDSRTCFRGYDWDCCLHHGGGSGRVNLMRDSCRWWHFTSESREGDMIERFQHIIN